MREVTPDHHAKSIGQEQTFGEDLTDPEDVRATLLGHAEQVAARLRRHHLRAARITVKIRDGEFKTQCSEEPVQHHGATDTV